jgi:hypothetical protein
MTALALLYPDVCETEMRLEIMHAIANTVAARNLARRRPDLHLLAELAIAQEANLVALANEFFDTVCRDLHDVMIAYDKSLS